MEGESVEREMLARFQGGEAHTIPVGKAHTTHRLDGAGAGLRGEEKANETLPTMEEAPVDEGGNLTHRFDAKENELEIEKPKAEKTMGEKVEPGVEEENKKAETLAMLEEPMKETGGSPITEAENAVSTNSKKNKWTDSGLEILEKQRRKNNAEKKTKKRKHALQAWMQYQKK